MNFTIKYRNSNGKLIECKIQAIDRRDCITKCRNQGIIPIEILLQTQTSENKKSADSSKILTKYNLSLWSLAISVVFFTIICLYFISAHNFTFQPNTPKNEKRQNSKSSLRNFSKSTNNIQQCIIKQANKEYKKEPALLTNIQKNVPGRRTPRPTRVIMYGRVDKDGKVAKPSPPLFKAIGDNHIEQLVNYMPGERFLSIVEPAQIARDFIAHMNEPIEIHPDDTPDQIKRKKNYIEVRNALIKELKSGADLEKLIIEARQTLDKVASLRELYINELSVAQQNGASDDDLDDLATAASTLLRQHGANPILSPRQEDIRCYQDSNKKEFQ